MATLTVQSATLAGTAITMSNCAAGGDEYVMTDSKTAILLTNAHAGNDYTVTVASGVNCNYGTDHDVAVSVVHGTTKLIGPFSYTRFKDANKKVQITYSGVTTMTIAVLRVP